MSKPVAGTKYTIVRDDTLWDIAATVYGTGRKYTVIWEANKSSLRSGDPNLIYPGEVLWIPYDSEMDQAKAELPSAAPITRDQPGDMAVVINDIEFAVESGNVLRTFDTAADGFTANLRFDPGDVDHLKAFKPYQYQPCKCYLGGKLKVTGFIYMHDLGYQTDKSSATVHGWSPTVDIVDCVSEPPFERSNVNLENRIRALIEPYGIGLVFDVDDDKNFKRVKIEKTEFIFDHISKLARQRNHIIGSTAAGELLVHDADLDKKPIGVIYEGSSTAERWKAKFDGRKRFARVKAYSSGPRKNKSATAKDTGIRLPRLTTVTANDTDDGDIQEAADAKVRKALEEALTLTVPVGSWYTPDGVMYEEGELITLISKRWFIPDGFDFLIRDVEYSYAKNKKSAILTVTPPSVYSKEDFEDPWA